MSKSTKVTLTIGPIKEPRTRVKRRAPGEPYRASFDSPCYFSYLSGCDDIKAGDEMINRGYRMNWHIRCQPEDFKG